MVDYRKVLDTFIEYIDEINLYIGSDMSAPIIDAINKQIPQKTIEDGAYDVANACPFCGNPVNECLNYCDCCGTKILRERSNRTLKVDGVDYSDVISTGKSTDGQESIKGSMIYR